MTDKPYTHISPPPDKRPAYLQLKPGDPWTFIYDVPINNAGGQPIRVGDRISKWFAFNEPGRVFEIVAIHEPATYETRYVGFEPPPITFVDKAEITPDIGPRQ